MCCTLRNQFPRCVEIVIKTLIIVITVTLLYVVFSNEGPGKLGF